MPRRKHDINPNSNNNNNARSNNRNRQQNAPNSFPRVQSEIERAAPDLQQKMLATLLQRVHAHMGQQDAARNEMGAFHQRCGTYQAPNMNKKELKEAREMYTRLLNHLKDGDENVASMLSDVKGWRTNAINAAKERGDINAIMVMNMRHGCLPLMNVSEVKEPWGAGAIGWPEGSKLEKDDEVAAFVEENKTWILAEVKCSVSNNRYECVDIDDQDKKVARFARKQLIPLPKYTVDYSRFAYMALPKNAIVLAIFPGTTCFYEGIVHEPPQRSSGYYQIRFVDYLKPNKFSEPAEVSERYVLPFKKDPVMYIRPEKRAQLGILKMKANASKTGFGKIRKVGFKLKASKLKGRVSVEREEVVDDRDVPGPAPPPVYIELSDEEDEKEEKKRIGRKRKTVKEPKVKIIRARVPEHKKRISTRQFGKRRIKRKKAAPKEEKDQKSNEEDKESKDSEEAGKGEEKIEQAETSEQKKTDSSEEMKSESSSESDLSEDSEDSEKDEKVEDQKKQEVVIDSNEGSVELGDFNNDPQEGTSSQFERARSESSESTSSDSNSGITISDNERTQRGYETEDEEEL